MPIVDCSLAVRVGATRHVSLLYGALLDARRAVTKEVHEASDRLEKFLEAIYREGKP